MLTWLLVALKALLVEVDVLFPGFLPGVHPNASSSHQLHLDLKFKLPFDPWKLNLKSFLPFTGTDEALRCRPSYHIERLQVYR